MTEKLKIEGLPSIVRYRMGEWDALYINGKLAVIGDSYLSDEWIDIMFGVDTRDSLAPLMGGSGLEGYAKTLAEAEQYEDVLAGKALKAIELREKAAALLAEAEELEK